MQEQLRAILQSIVPFSDSEFEQISACFIPKRVLQRELLLNNGDICHEFYVVLKGCIRVYFLDENGNEKTRYIMPDHYIGTALTSFIMATPSFELIDAVCDSEILAISRENFYLLNETIPQWRVFYQKILEMAYSFQTRKLESIVTLSAQQRFEQAISENSSLFQMVSNKILASYLDMTPETLSRLKSKQVRS